MNRCLALARQGQGRVGNGAMVGAVLVRGDRIIAESFHRAFGESHAERALLESFSGFIEPDDILYVNLEPCCHQGKTPPCSDILIDRGIKHVVVGMPDPDIRVSGKGIAQLRSSGVTVSGPVLPELCERANRGFLSVRRSERPWITIKKAQTVDGKNSSVHSRLKITSKDQDIWSHTYLRALHDAIIVGVDTVISDDPILNKRFDQYNIKNKKLDQKSFYKPWRIVLDPRGRTPKSARVVLDDAADRTIIITARDDRSWEGEMTVAGARVISVPLREGVFEWVSLWNALTVPSGNFQGLTSILVEGGAKTWEIFRAAGMVDEEVTLVGQS